MYNPQPDLVMKMFSEFQTKNRDYISNGYLDWEILEIPHPKYGIIYQPVPVIVVDYKW